jgi:hypothetical protein
MDISFQHLNFVIDHCSKTSNYLDAKRLNNIQFFCIGLLERLSNSSVALKKLLEEINAIPSLEYACGIILRSTLLDALIVLNLYNLIIENETSTKTEDEKEQIIKEFCETLLSDGLENTLKYIKVARDVNILTHNELANNYRNLVDKFQNFFEPFVNDEGVPVVKNKNWYSPTDLFKKIANNPKLKGISKIYDSYLFFSKYDHFGILYYEVRRQENITRLKLISNCIELFIYIQSLLHLVLRMYSNKDVFLDYQSEIAARYLSDKIL